MGLLSGVLGNASEIEFTDKRLILTDVQGMTNGGHVQVRARQRSLKLGPRLQSGE